MSLPQNLTLPLMQTQWASSLNPLLANPIVNGIFLNNQTLVSGSNVINHLLSRMPQGWFITNINAAVTVYSSAPFTNQVLTLTASGAAVVNIYVF